MICGKRSLISVDFKAGSYINMALSIFYLFVEVPYLVIMWSTFFVKFIINIII